MKKIIVLGGGTAGWLTALLVREFYPDFDITLVESDAIGILGAGEGTVPHIVSVLDLLKIPVSALFKYCSATLKTGIKFTNWHGDGTSYFHNFSANDELEMWSLDRMFRFNVLPTMLVGQNINLDEASFVAKIAAQGKVPFVWPTAEESRSSQFPDPINSVHHLASFALHFDARLLAKYLSKIAQADRNINRIEGKLAQVMADQQGNITGLLLDNGRSVEGDFIFDCSGFARLILGKHFKETWVDYSEYLPMNAAMPFFLPHDGTKLPAFTESIAMKYGWIWKIPVQDRYGCGYVFDSSFIDNNEARLEAQEYFGCEINSPGTFNFGAGSFRKSLVKNCFAVGLSQNFVEPLEATSIWVFTKNLINFLKSDAINVLSETLERQINTSCALVTDAMVDFLQLHYLTQRRDSTFWRSFRDRMTIAPGLQEKLALWQELPVFDHDTVQLEMFKAPSWITVGAGTRNFREATFKRFSDNLCFERNIAQGYELLKKKQAYAGNACMSHGEFIALLKTAGQSSE